MVILGQVDFQNKTFSLHNIVNNDNTISITNNLLSLSYKDSDNQLITYRKNISDLLTINAGDFVISSNVLDDNDGLGGFGKISKSIHRNKKHIARVLSSIDWNDNQINQKFDVIHFTDSNQSNRIAVKIPVIMF